MSLHAALRYAASAAVGLLVLVMPAAAQDDFYRDKTVKIMVGHSPGGSFDFYARLAAEMLKKHHVAGFGLQNRFDPRPPLLYPGRHFVRSNSMHID